MKKFFAALISLILIFSLLTPFGVVASENTETEAAEAVSSERPGFFASLSSGLALSRAMSNLDAELTERISTTPFQGFGMLMDSLEYGTTNLNYYNRREWTNSRTDTTRVTENSGKFTLQSDMSNMNFALSGEIGDGDENIDFEAYIDSQRFAVSSSWFGDEIYGINFATFGQDFAR
ncbi:MAG: hypothetical protein LBI27_10175, partial [Clostridiales bacterium]|nr:hypothetical protein [Clostridiales bacterium]